MLFKEKLYLANCDSVRQLDHEEIRKRFLTAAVFADGVVLSPNVLIDNPGILSALGQKNIARWFREEGLGKVVVRGNGIRPGASLRDYFDALPGSYRVSHLGGRRKNELETHAPQALDSLHRSLDTAQNTLEAYQTRWEPVTLSPDSLTREILSQPGTHHYTGSNISPLTAINNGELTLSSRSAWYQHVEQHAQMSAAEKAHFKLTVIDAAYNRLFTQHGEAFAMDRIRVLEHMPPAMLDTTLTIRGMRRQRRWLINGYRLFGLVTTLGTDGLAELLADEAVGYMEDKAKQHGHSWFTRKNWFGLYDNLTHKIGVELT